MGLPCLVMGTQETRGDALGIRFKPSEREAVDRAAMGARRRTSDWAREVLLAAATGGGLAAAPKDPEFQAALDSLMRRHPMGTAASIVRSCVLALDRMEEAGQNPFRVLSEEPAPPKRPSGRG